MSAKTIYISRARSPVPPRCVNALGGEGCACDVHTDYRTETGVYLPDCLDRRHVTGTRDAGDATTYAGTEDAPECGVSRLAGMEEAGHCDDCARRERQSATFLGNAGESLDHHGGGASLSSSLVKSSGFGAPRENKRAGSTYAKSTGAGSQGAA